MLEKIKDLKGQLIGEGDKVKDMFGNVGILEVKPKSKENNELIYYIRYLEHTVPLLVMQMMGGITKYKGKKW